MLKKFFIVTIVLVIASCLFLATGVIAANKIDKKDCLNSLNETVYGDSKIDQIDRELGGTSADCSEFNNDSDVKMKENQLEEWKNSSSNPANYHAVNPNLWE